MRFTGFVFVLLAAATVASAQTTQTTQTTQTAQGSGQRANFTAEGNAALVLEIGARQYGANNQLGGSASNSAARGKLESYVWTSIGLCGMSASTTEPTSVPGTGWHFTGEIMPTQTGSDQLTVNVSWQRLWSNGARLSDSARSSGTQTITLRAGERIVLDRVVSAGPSLCGAVDAKLEAAVVSQPAYRLVFNGRINEAGGMGRGGRVSAAPMGQQGAQGQQGGRGQGAPGRQGQQGQMGQQGQQGQAGQQGQQGQQGGRGQGAQGQQGQQGQQGVQAQQGQANQQGQMAQSRGGRGGGRGTSTSSTNTTGATNVTATTTASAGQGGGRGAGGGRGSGSADAAALSGQAQALMTNARQQRLQFITMARAYDAELWLVHRKPDGSETVQQQAVHFGGIGGANGAFAFPPIQVPTSKGPITIDITGRLQSSVGSGDRQGLTVVTSPTPDESNAQHLTISIDRRARSTGLDITGGSHMVIDVPKPTDVTSFEFPALQKSTEDLLKGHQFSLRLQVAPTGK